MINDDQNFAMDLTGWRHLQSRFKTLLGLASGRHLTSSARTKMMDFIKEEKWHSYDAGELRLGLGWSRSAKAWKPEIVAGSLYLAFLAMLWLDISSRERSLLPCANPHCGRFFVTDKRNQVYCESNCASKVAKRRWWNANGGKRREAKNKIP
jgi:hypothetical protein